MKEYNQRPEVKKRQREYQQKIEYKEKRKIYDKKHRIEYNQKPKVKEDRKAHSKEYYQKNKVRFRGYNKKYRDANKEKIKEYWENYQLKNREWINKKRREKHKNPKIKECKREYYLKNKKRILLNEKLKRKNNKNYYIGGLLRRRFNKVLLFYSKTGKIKNSSGYGINYKKIIEYLKPFPKNIKNYQVDHVIPLRWFNFDNPKEVKWAFAPENHQWLTKEQNLIKGDRYIGIPI